MNEIQSKNRMSAKALMQSENSDLEFVNNPKKPGSMFFVCGDKSGYISPKVKEAFNAGNLSVDDMQYAECSTDNGQTWIPCLMVVGNSKANVAATFTL